MKFLKCIKSVEVEETNLSYFTEGRIYEVITKKFNEYAVKDNFKRTHTLIDYEGDKWFTTHFIPTEKVPTKYEEKTVNIWTNGSAIRKYTGQDKLEGYNRGKRNGTWYKATAVITRVLEEEEV